MIKRILFALVGLCIATAAHAQTVIYYKQASGFNPIPVSVANPLPITGAFSISSFQPSASGARGTPITVTSSDSSGTVPTGAVVLVSNPGANLAYCNANGVAATASDQPIAPSGGWFAFTIPSGVTTIHCIAPTGNTTVNMVGGSGVPTGTGGGGGGSGGAVTIASGGVASGAYASGSIASGAVASGAYASGAFASGAAASGSWADGSIVTLGTKADTACTSAPCTTNGWLAGLPADLAAPPNLAYAATYGACVTVSSGVGAWCGDGKSTPYVDIGAVGTAAVLVGAGTTGTGSQRVTAAQDTTTIAGSAPGTAGTPSANVVSVQGESSMTPVLVTPSAPADPCFSSSKTNLAISQNGTSSVQLIALSGSTTIYVCSLSLIAAGATTVAITAGTGTACATPTAAVIGSTAANIANSISLAANGGLTLGSGVGTIAKGVASSELCMILGTSVYVSGNLTYVQQ